MLRNDVVKWGGKQRDAITVMGELLAMELLTNKSYPRNARNN